MRPPQVIFPSNGKVIGRLNCPILCLELIDNQLWLHLFCQWQKGLGRFGHGCTASLHVICVFMVGFELASMEDRVDSQMVRHVQPK